MAGNYINTPATERGDYTSISEKHVDFSFAQPFGSPSKNPAQDLRNHMKGMRSGTKPLQTPRVRNPLVDKRNPSGPQKQEFTPLLKSAKRNQLIRESILGEKENATSGPLETPAGFRSSYAGQALDLPASSSMMDDDISGNCDATPVAPAQSSSMMDSTPLPHLPDGGGAAMLDQGNMLSLRDQETKLDQIQKDNFGLKLKIHYLEQALDKTGTAFQQETLKENVELKTTKMTIEADLKRQRKRLQQAQLELEEYRQKFTTFEETVKKRHATQHKTEEFKRLQQIAEESQRVAKKREQELAAMQERVEEAEKEQQTAVAQQDPEELQRLRDDVLDLEAAVQDRDRQLDEKDEQLENLEGQLKSTKASTLEAEHLQQDIDELEAELKEKDACLQEKDAQLRERSFVIEQRDDELADLQHRLRTAESGKDEVLDLEAVVQDRDRQLDEKDEQLENLEGQLKSTKASTLEAEHLQQDIDKLEAELKEKDACLQEKDAQLRERSFVIERRDDELADLQHRLRTAESGKDEVLDLEAAVQDRDRQLDEKDEQLENLEGQLKSTKASTLEAEHLQQDIDKLEAELKEKDACLQEKDAQLRERSFVIEQRDDELADLQHRLRTAESGKDEAAQRQSRQIQRLQNADVQDARQRLQEAKADTEARFLECRQALEDEILVLEENFDAVQGEKTLLEARVQELEETVQRAQRRNVNGTPIRERNELHERLRDAESRAKRLQQRLGTVEKELLSAQEEHMTAEERRDLHDLLKHSKIEAEQLQIQLTERDKRLSTLARKEGELRGQLQSTQIELDDFRAQVSELEIRARSSTSREQGLRAQVKELKDAKIQLEELEMQMNQRNSSSSSHARREGELRTSLRNAKLELESLQIELEKKDARLQSATRKEQQLRKRLAEAREAEALQAHREDTQSQLDQAQLDVQTLQRHLHERDTRLQVFFKREQEARKRLRSLQTTAEGDRTLDDRQWSKQLASAAKKHQGELKGLVKQIQFLQAKCSREEAFRGDLVFTKQWFLMQVKMYDQCNKADLGLLEEMGITPDTSHHGKKHSLRVVGSMAIACIRMKRLSERWAGTKQLQESLARELEGVRRKRTVVR